jgi:hypothetical protein
MLSDDRHESGPAPESTPEVPDRVDAYLSRKAQHRLDPGAVVCERADGTWYLAVPGNPTLTLGESFGRAKEALWALMAAERPRRGDSG